MSSSQLSHLDRSRSFSIDGWWKANQLATPRLPAMIDCHHVIPCQYLMIYCMWMIWMIVDEWLQDGVSFFILFCRLIWGPEAMLWFGPKCPCQVCQWCHQAGLWGALRRTKHHSCQPSLWGHWNQHQLPVFCPFWLFYIYNISHKPTLLNVLDLLE